ncbi:energy transducer TonB [Paucibacter sp. B2R-40]|nr:energy transducer TonB [Paucibacter sp. B2R-40]
MAALEFDTRGEGAAIEALVPTVIDALETNALQPVSTAPSGSLLPRGEWDAYVPRPLLTKPPQALESVLLAWPDFPAEQAHFEAVAALYIDEAGVVQALRVQQGQLPEPLLEAARRAFEGRRFIPGELNGQAVKTRIYVEIMFDQPQAPKSLARGISR